MLVDLVVWGEGMGGAPPQLVVYIYWGFSLLFRSFSS